MTVARPTRHQDGVTLIETLVAATLVGAFFAAIFEINAVCLRYIDASKEAVAAVQGVQDRIEGLRNLAFTDLTSPAYMMNAQATPAPSGPRPVSLVYPSNSSDLASDATEEVTVSAYPSGSPSITYTRPPRGRGLSERFSEYRGGLQQHDFSEGKRKIYLERDLCPTPAERRGRNVDCSRN